MKVGREARVFAALGTFLITHALGLVAMVVLLLPGISPHLPLDARAEYVRDNALAWRAGWLTWQASALSDAWLTLELLRRSRELAALTAARWMLSAAALLLIALVPDQYAEARMVTDFVRVQALNEWHEQLRLYVTLTGTWGCLAYTGMTLCWLRAVHSVRPSGRSGLWIQASMFVAFAAAAVANYFTWSGPVENVAAFDAAAALNGYAFPVLLISVGAAVVRLSQAGRPA